MPRVRGDVAVSTMRRHASLRSLDPLTLQNALPSPPPSGSAASSARISSRIAAIVASGVSTAAPAGEGAFQPFASAGGAGTARTAPMGAIAFCALSSSFSGSSGSFISTSPSAPSGTIRDSTLTGASSQGTGAAPNRRSSSLQRVPSRKPRLLSEAARAPRPSTPWYMPHGFSSGRCAFSSRVDPSGPWGWPRSLLSSSSSSSSLASFASPVSVLGFLRFLLTSEAAVDPLTRFTAPPPEGCTATWPHGATT